MENYNNHSHEALKSDYKPQISNDSLPILNEANVIAEGEEKTTRYLLLLTVATALSGSLFGYDTGVISGALVLIGDDLGSPLTTISREWITSVLTVGALVAALTAGVLSDHIGRKRVILISDVFFIIGAITQAAAQNFATMYAGRLIMGFGVGFASCIAPLFIGEIAPTLKRGRLTTLNVCAITLGQVVAYALGAAFQDVAHGWRYLIGIGAAPAILQLVLMHLLPESPRYQLRAGKDVEAKATMRRIYPMASEDQIDFKISVIKEYITIAMQAEKALPFMQRFLNMFRIGKNRRALACGAGLQLLQQLSGFNSLMYYSATIFATIGFSNPTAVGLIVSGTNFLMTCVALQIIDRVGRRKIMIVSTLGMVFGLALASISFHFLTRGSGGNLVEGFSYPETWSAIVILAMVVYVALYAVGTGNVPWLQGELFGIDARGFGTSLSTGANWSGNLVIASTYLTLMEAITPTGTFALYAGICFLGFVFVFFCYPETSGLSLEEVQSIFVENFGVKRSLALRKQKEDIRRGKEQVA